MGGAGRDEAYVMDLCDEVLHEAGERQHTFDWLRGDPGSSGRVYEVDDDNRVHRTDS